MSAAAMEVGKRSVTVSGVRIPLSPSEATVLTALSQASGELVTRDQLVAVLYGRPERQPSSNVTEVTVSRLRKKLPEHIGSRIHSVRGKGYRLVGEG